VLDPVVASYVQHISSLPCTVVAGYLVTSKNKLGIEQRSSPSKKVKLMKHAIYLVKSTAIVLLARPIPTTQWKAYTPPPKVWLYFLGLVVCVVVLPLLLQKTKV